MLRLTHVLNDLPTKTFEKDDIIYTSGTVAKNGFIILSGLVTIFSNDRHGVERRLTSAQQYELIPDGWLFAPNSKLDYSYRAYTRCVCAEVEREKLYYILLNNPEALLELLIAQDKKILNIDNRIETLVQSRAEDKMIYMLKYIVSRVGVPTSDGCWVETMYGLTRSELADALGITRETATIELQKLEKAGVMSPIGKGKYLINKQKLNQLAGS